MDRVFGRKQKDVNFRTDFLHLDSVLSEIQEHALLYPIRQTPNPYHLSNLKALTPFWKLEGDTPGVNGKGKDVWW